MGAEIVEGIKSGVTKWGIDQQTYLQAYLPVVVLTGDHRYGVLPGSNFDSGPAFVTVNGLEKFEALAGKYR